MKSIVNKQRRCTPRMRDRRVYSVLRVVYAYKSDVEAGRQCYVHVLLLPEALCVNSSSRNPNCRRNCFKSEHFYEKPLKPAFRGLNCEKKEAILKGICYKILEKNISAF